MQVQQYAPTSDDVLALARAETTAQAKPLLAALERRIAELTARLFANPRHSDELTDDCGGIVCELRGLRWLGSLVTEAKETARQTEL